MRGSRKCSREGVGVWTEIRLMLIVLILADETPWTCADTENYLVSPFPDRGGGGVDKFYHCKNVFPRNSRGSGPRPLLMIIPLSVLLKSWIISVHARLCVRWWLFKLGPWKHPKPPQNTMLPSQTTLLPPLTTLLLPQTCQMPQQITYQWHECV